MILLFNLNSYLGGGEVLLVRMVKELHTRGVECGVLCSKGSYIEEEIRESGIYCQTWPIINDSYIYMNRKDKQKVKDFIQDKFATFTDLTVFTFCLRDTYNSIEFFKHVQSGHVKLCMGIFHPDETKYVSKLSIKKNSIIDNNRKILQEYSTNDSIAFMNDRNLESCLPGADVTEFKIIPLPIPLDESREIVGNDFFQKDTYSILWIGRFVDFKFTAIMNIIRFVQAHNNFNLTIVGYGPYEGKIKSYINSNDIHNVKMIGQIKPEEIKDIVKGMDIGYAMGTSVLEIAQYGIPTIISPMMRPRHCNVYTNTCVGVFGCTGNYNVGEVAQNAYNDLLKLDATVKDVITHYDVYRDKTLEFIQNFDLSRVVDNYQEVFSNCKLEVCNVKNKPPIPGLCKRVYKTMSYGLMKIRYSNSI